MSSDVIPHRASITHDLMSPAEPFCRRSQAGTSELADAPATNNFTMEFTFFSENSKIEIYFIVNSVTDHSRVITSKRICSCVRSHHSIVSPVANYN